MDSLTDFRCVTRVNDYQIGNRTHQSQVIDTLVSRTVSSSQARKAGEFILGYPDENGETALAPVPQELRHNGTFVALTRD